MMPLPVAGLASSEDPGLEPWLHHRKVEEAAVEAACRLRGQLLPVPALAPLEDLRSEACPYRQQVEDTAGEVPELGRSRSWRQFLLHPTLAGDPESVLRLQRWKVEEAAVEALESEQHRLRSQMLPVPALEVEKAAVEALELERTRNRSEMLPPAYPLTSMEGLGWVPSQMQP